MVKFRVRTLLLHYGASYLTIESARSFGQG
jgi:hypothetical protein